MSIFIALATALATCIALIFIHINRKIPLLLALPSIAVGVGIALLAALLESLGLYFNVIGGPDPVMTLFYGLFVVGLASQVLSFLFLRFVIYTQKEFKEPLFVMLFAIWMAMGAVLLETFSMPTSDYFLLPMLNWAGHLSLAIVLSYFVGMAKFSTDAQQNFVYLNSGLGAAIVVQGLHEFFCWQQNYPNLVVLILGTGFIAMVLTAHLLRQKAAEKEKVSQQKRLEHLYSKAEEEED